MKDKGADRSNKKTRKTA